MNVVTLIMQGQYVWAAIMLASTLFVLFVALPFHEFAHAFAANKLGDPTAKYQGRLTLNPFKHLDFIGAMLLLFFGFGWAKPVPVNQRNFRNPKGDMAITAFAGPLSNLIVAFVVMLIMHIVNIFYVNVYINYFLTSAATVNIYLAVFNLVPVPPLDGSRIFNLLLPKKWYFAVMRYERIILLALFAVLFLGFLDVPLGWLYTAAGRLLDFATGYVELALRALLS